jgi:hypothetical protein
METPVEVQNYVSEEMTDKVPPRNPGKRSSKQQSDILLRECMDTRNGVKRKSSVGMPQLLAVNVMVKSERG